MTQRSVPQRLAPEELLSRCTFPPAASELVCAVSGGAGLPCAAGPRDGRRVPRNRRPCGPRASPGVADRRPRWSRVPPRVGSGPNFVPRGWRCHLVPTSRPGPRMARRGVLPAGTATGHTMDDQAETVFLNLLRGAGLDGLAAMRRGFHHPLLPVRRSETRAICLNEGLEPVEDPTNQDPRFLRNRVRHDLLPLCSQIAGRDVVPILARQAGVFAAEADLLDELAAEVDVSDAAALNAAPCRARRAGQRGAGCETAATRPIWRPWSEFWRLPGGTPGRRTWPRGSGFEDLARRWPWHRYHGSIRARSGSVCARCRLRHADIHGALMLRPV